MAPVDVLESKRIAVLGTGANGGSIAADLVLAGLDVTLIEQWPAHVEAMRADGLSVRMPQRSVTVPVQAMHLCEVATLRRPFDIVLILVKAYDVRWACELIAPHVSANGLVVAVQNGMTADTVAEIVGAQRTVGAVIEVSSAMFDPGIIQRHTPPERSWFAVGAPSGWARDRVEEIAVLLGHSGTVARVEDIHSAKWMKLVSNCTTLVTTAALGLPMLAALETRGMRDFMLRCGQEALDTGLTLGYSVLPIFGLGTDDIADSATVVETMLDRLYDGFVLPHTTTTILQDWEKGRHSEVDDLNGVIVEAQMRLGVGAVAAPANAAVLEVAHRIERGELSARPENVELLTELATAAANVATVEGDG